MNHHQRKVLHAIFAHPVNANLDLKDVDQRADRPRGRDRHEDEEPHRGEAERTDDHSCISPTTA